MNPENRTTRIELPPGGFFVGPALDLIGGFADRCGMEPDRQRSLKSAAEVAINMVVKSNERGKSTERVAVDVFERDGSLFVEVLNRGVPIFLTGNESSFHEAARQLDRVSIENLGRQGQTVVLGVRLGEEALKRSLDSSGITQATLEATEGEIAIRELQLGEEQELSRLFYSVYGYNYINDMVYYPERLKAMREEGKLISIVGALPSGRIVGHVGLIKWADHPPVYEPCLGVTDPGVKSRGLFGQIFQRTMDRVNETPMQYCFFDFVTNHDFSQRFVSRFNTCDLALFVGCQSKATQAKLEKLGLGIDPPEMDRYSLLFSILPRVKYPFGREILLPSGLGDALDFLLKPLNLSWSPAPRFELLPPGGDYQAKYHAQQNAVVFDLHQPGRAAVDRILREWHQCLRNGYQYAGLEVPLDAPGIGNLYDILAGEGFFIGGFVPYHFSDRLGFRFQTIGPTKVAWDDIKVHTPSAKRLLELIRENYERNEIL